MKNILLFLNLLCFISICNAQFTDDFNAGLPSNWSMTNISSNDWGFTTVENPQAGAGHLRVFSAILDPGEYLITPQFTPVVATSDYISFYVKRQNNSNDVDFNVRVATSISGLTNSGSIIASQSFVSTNYLKYEYDLTAYVGQNIYVAIQPVANSFGGAYLYLDTFENFGGPSCNTPGSLSISNITNTTADLSWVDFSTPNPATIWDVEVYEDGTSATGTPTFNDVIFNNPFTITGLNPYTDYRVRVRSNCGAAESNWSSATLFTTKTGTNFTIDCNNSDILTLAYCYEDNSDIANAITFTSNNGEQLQLSFDSSFRTEINKDFLVILDSNGSPIPGYALSDQVSGFQNPFSVTSTGDRISFYINSDNQTSCSSGGVTSSEINFTVSCINETTTPIPSAIAINKITPKAGFDVTGGIRALNRNASGVLYECNADIEGTFGYDTNDKSLKVCTNVSGIYKWATLEYNN